ncbi:hypothetical protein [Streptomyces griseus]|uniref:hypothetical protein n=1 Tax=Streptomyces griseus TaxID=1911 RepID=UPI000A3982B9|nr:hypothetical protein [Streptomyces fimicarius]
MSSAPVPTIGRAVHYVSQGSPVRPDGTQAFPSVRRSAEITEVDEEGRVGLLVKNPTGLFFHPIGHEAGPCPHAEPVPGAPLQPGTWHWPERV